MQDQLHQPKQLFRVSVQEAVVAHAAEAPWKNMLQDQPQEFSACKGAGSSCAGFGFGIAERDIAVAIGDDIALGNHTPVEVARQVFQRRLAAPDPAAVDDPLAGGVVRDCQPGPVQAIEHARPEDFCQSELIEQIAPIDLLPASSQPVDAAAGDDDVDVRMKSLVARVGVQHRRHAQFGAELGGVHPEVLEGGHRAVAQQIVDDPLMSPGQRSQLRGQGERGHEIVDRQQFGALAIQPLGGLLILTFRATAVAA